MARVCGGDDCFCWVCDSCGCSDGLVGIAEEGGVLGEVEGGVV